MLPHPPPARVVVHQQQRVIRRAEDNPLRPHATDGAGHHSPAAPVRQMQKHPVAGALVAHDEPVAVRPHRRVAIRQLGVLLEADVARASADRRLPVGG